MEGNVDRRVEEAELVEYVFDKSRERGRFFLAGVFGLLGICIVGSASPWELLFSC